MYFPKISLRLVNSRTIQKGDKNYTFVKLADKTTFDAQDFMLAKGVDPSVLVAGTDYDVTLEVDGKFTSVHLSALPPAPAPAAK